MATGRENAVEPGTNVWFETRNATGLHDGHPNTSLRNFVIVIQYRPFAT